MIAGRRAKLRAQPLGGGMAIRVGSPRLRPARAWLHAPAAVGK